MDHGVAGGDGDGGGGGVKAGGQVRRDFFWLGVDRVVRLPAGLLVTALMARHLGVEAFGWLNQGLAILAVGLVVGQLGLDLIVVRETARRPERAGAVVATVFGLRLVAGLMVMAVMGGMAGKGGWDAELMKALAWGALLPALATPGLWFQGKGRARVAAGWGLGAFVVFTGLRLGAIRGGADVVVFAWLFVGEQALAAGLTGWAMRREGGRFAWREARVEEARRLMRDGWPLMVGAAMSALYMKIDLLMLTAMRGAEAAGVYAAGTRLSEVAYAVPALLAMSAMAGLSAGEGEERAAKVAAFYRAMAGLGYLLCLPVALGGWWVVPRMFGGEFEGAGWVAQVHIWSVFFLGMTLARGRVLVAEGREKFTMVCAMVGCGLAAGLNVVLIPLYGVMGAAVGTVLTHALAGIGLTVLYPATRETGVLLLKALGKPGFKGL